MLVDDERIMPDYYEDLDDIVTLIQDGDTESIKSLPQSIVRDYIAINAKDRDGCSLLHWAAINNRYEIASFIIDNNRVVNISSAAAADSETEGNLCVGGGVLNETPLQWAIRKRYYAMAELLVTKAKCDMAHKSAQGSDALHLACKLGDINAVFLLLNWGANPNSVDRAGDTPLLWLLKHKTGLAATEIIKLLLKFGASPVYQNQLDDGNSALHVLSAASKVNLSLALLLYQAAGPQGALLPNAQQFNPYNLAVVKNNRLMAGFIYDMLLFLVCPYWLPSAVAALLFLGFFLLVHLQGLLYGGGCWLLLHTLATCALSQRKIVAHRSRATLGLFLGACLALALSLALHIWPFLGPHSAAWLAASFAVSAYLLVSFSRSRPAVAKAESLSSLAAKIVQASPQEGTDEEAAACGEPSVPGSRLVRDGNTGLFERALLPQAPSAGPDLGGAALSNWVVTPSGRAVRRRGLGPRLCGSCLCDRRAVSISAVCVPRRIGRASRGGGASGGATVISMASHCEVCRACVLDADHHCRFLGNCAGKGNRRLLLLAMAAFALACLSFLMAALWTHFVVHCREANTGPYVLRLFVVEACMARSHTVFFLLSGLAGLLGVSALLFVVDEMRLVMRETTLDNYSRGTYVRQAAPHRRQMLNLRNFLMNGTYNVTYPKPSPSASPVPEEEPGGVEEGATSPDQPPGAVMKLLSFIDRRLTQEGTAEELQGLLRAPEPPPPSGLPPAPPPSRPTPESVSDSEEEDYDEEFAASHLNDPDLLYRSDGDEELGPRWQGSAPSPGPGHVNSDVSNRRRTGQAVESEFVQQIGQARAGSSLSNSVSRASLKPSPVESIVDRA